MHVSELARLGADIEIEGPSAIVKGGKTVERRAGDGERLARERGVGDCRFGGQGTTQVNRIYHLDRGYEKMDAEAAKTWRPHPACRRKMKMHNKLVANWAQKLKSLQEECAPQALISIFSMLCGIQSSLNELKNLRSFGGFTRTVRISKPQ